MAPLVPPWLRLWNCHFDDSILLTRISTAVLIPLNSFFYRAKLLLIVNR